MIDKDSYIDFPQKRESKKNEVYEYDSTATPKRVTYLYEVSYVNDNSQDDRKS